MSVQILVFDNPFNPGRRRIGQAAQGITPAAWLARRGDSFRQQPFVCLVDGEARLRKDWDSVSPESHMAFIVLPAGGALSGVLSVGLLLFAPALTPLVAGSLGVSTAVATGLIHFTGSLLIGSIFSPRGARLTEFGNTQSASPTYTLEARGNHARLGAPIPVVYGHHRIFPDYAASPWSHYHNNEQYLHQLFAIGQGEYQVDSIMIDDTPIANFPEVQHQIVRPDGQIKLFDADYVTAVEVVGQELRYNEAVGGYAINPPDTRTTELQIDIVFPSGLCEADDNGSLKNRTVSWRVEARKIDDDGVADGDWSTLVTRSETAATNTALRQTYSYSVSSGRYEMRLTRLSSEQTSVRIADRFHWQAARAKLSRAINTEGVTLLAVKQRATDALSLRSRGLVNCIVTRKLPSWSKADGWSEPEATRSIAWAIADIARAAYGGALQDGRIDLEALASLNDVWSGRGDHFDAVFDNPITVWEALARTSQAGRAGCFLQGGVLRTVRDQRQTIPVMLFTPRNIRKGSFRIDYRLADEDSATVVQAEFHNRRCWLNDTVTASIDEDTHRKARVVLFGVTEEAHALREAQYLARVNKYRRKAITFSTEMEGLILTVGDLIAFSHPIPDWGIGGSVIGFDADNRILSLSEPVAFDDDDRGHLCLRDRKGAIQGQWVVTPGSLAHQVVLPADATPTVELAGTAEPTLFAFGQKSDSLYLLARVVSIIARGIHHFEITALAEDNRVHDEQENQGISD